MNVKNREPARIPSCRAAYRALVYSRTRVIADYVVFQPYTSLGQALQVVLFKG